MLHLGQERRGRARAPALRGTAARGHASVTYAGSLLLLAAIGLVALVAGRLYVGAFGADLFRRFDAAGAAAVAGDRGGRAHAAQRLALGGGPQRARHAAVRGRAAARTAGARLATKTPGRPAAARVRQRVAVAPAAGRDDRGPRAPAAAPRGRLRRRQRHVHLQRLQRVAAGPRLLRALPARMCSRPSPGSPPCGRASTTTSGSLTGWRWCRRPRGRRSCLLVYPATAAFGMVLLASLRLAGGASACSAWGHSRPGPRRSCSRPCPTRSTGGTTTASCSRPTRCRCCSSRSCLMARIGSPGALETPRRRRSSPLPVAFLVAVYVPLLPTLVLAMAVGFVPALRACPQARRAGDDLAAFASWAGDSSCSCSPGATSSGAIAPLHGFRRQRLRWSHTLRRRCSSSSSPSARAHRLPAGRTWTSRPGACSTASLAPVYALLVVVGPAGRPGAGLAGGHARWPPRCSSCRHRLLRARRQATPGPADSATPGTSSSSTQWTARSCSCSASSACRRLAGRPAVEALPVAGRRVGAARSRSSRCTGPGPGSSARRCRRCCPDRPRCGSARRLKRRMRELPPARCWSSASPPTAAAGSARSRRCSPIHARSSATGPRVPRWGPTSVAGDAVYQFAPLPHRRAVRGAGPGGLRPVPDGRRRAARRGLCAPAAGRFPGDRARAEPRRASSAERGRAAPSFPIGEGRTKIVVLSRSDRPHELELTLAALRRAAGIAAAGQRVGGGDYNRSERAARDGESTGPGAPARRPDRPAASRWPPVAGCERSILVVEAGAQRLRPGRPLTVVGLHVSQAGADLDSCCDASLGPRIGPNARTAPVASVPGSVDRPAACCVAPGCQNDNYDAAPDRDRDAAAGARRDRADLVRRLRARRVGGARGPDLAARRPRHHGRLAVCRTPGSTSTSATRSATTTSWPAQLPVPARLRDPAAEAARARHGARSSPEPYYVVLYNVPKEDRSASSAATTSSPCRSSSGSPSPPPASAAAR